MERAWVAVRMVSAVCERGAGERHRRKPMNDMWHLEVFKAKNVQHTNLAVVPAECVRPSTPRPSGVSIDGIARSASWTHRPTVSSRGR